MSAQNSKKTVGRPFKKGVSGNPGGRPVIPDWFKKKNDEALSKLLSMMDSEDEAIALQATKLVLAYNLGSPSQSVELGAQGGGPLQIQIVNYGAKAI